MKHLPLVVFAVFSVLEFTFLWIALSKTDGEAFVFVLCCTLACATIFIQNGGEFLCCYLAELDKRRNKS